MNKILTRSRDVFSSSLRNKIIFFTCSILISSSVLLGALVITRATNLSLEMAKENVAHEANLISIEFKSAYKKLQNDAFVVSGTPPIEGILRSTANAGIDPVDGSTTEMWRTGLETIFSSILSARSSYTQIRYIGVANGGMELARVNQSPNGIYVVPHDELQTKGDEYYFQRALDLKPGEAYFSEVTYNREFGKVEEQLVPTLRVVAPIFSSNGDISGMIVINTDYSAMLRELLNVIQVNRRIIVTNDAGDYMERSANGALSQFFFQAASTPDNLPLVMADEEHALDNMAWVTPSKNDLIYSVRMPISSQFDDSLIVITVVAPKQELFQETWKIRNDTIFMALVLILLSIGCSTWAASRLTSPLKKVTNFVHDARITRALPEFPVDQPDEIGKLAFAFQNLSRELVESEAQVRAIFNNVVDSVITIDERGIIQNYNPASEELFGFTSDEVMGKNIKMLMPEKIAIHHDKYLKDHKATGVKHIIGATRELEGQRKDGSVFPMELSVSEVTVGKKRLFTGIVRDITERKQMETMKNEFISTVNHELRTPLTSIQASLGILQKKLNGNIDTKEQRLLDISLQSTKRLSILVNDILDIEKIAAGKMEFYFEVCDIGKLVTDIIDRHHSLAENYHVTFEMNVDLPEVFCNVDQSRFNQALVNLLSNAAKFSPKGGVVDIRASLGENGDVVIQVEDHGPGIPESFRDKIFQRFAQADSSATRAAGGSGLGLNITKSIVETLSGDISFETVEGKGTTFIIRLPACAPKEDEGTGKWQAA